MDSVILEGRLLQDKCPNLTHLEMLRRVADPVEDVVAASLEQFIASYSSLRNIELSEGMDCFPMTRGLLVHLAGRPFLTKFICSALCEAEDLEHVAKTVSTPFANLDTLEIAVEPAGIAPLVAMLPCLRSLHVDLVPPWVSDDEDEDGGEGEADGGGGGADEYFLGQGWVAGDEGGDEKDDHIFEQLSVLTSLRCLSVKYGLQSFCRRDLIALGRLEKLVDLRICTTRKLSFSVQPLPYLTGGRPAEVHLERLFCAMLSRLRVLVFHVDVSLYRGLLLSIVRHCVSAEQLDLPDLGWDVHALHLGTRRAVLFPKLRELCFLALRERKPAGIALTLLPNHDDDNDHDGTMPIDSDAIR